MGTEYADGEIIKVLGLGILNIWVGSDLPVDNWWDFDYFLKFWKLLSHWLWLRHWLRRWLWSRLYNLFRLYFWLWHRVGDDCIRWGNLSMTQPRNVSSVWPQFYKISSRYLWDGFSHSLETLTNRPKRGRVIFIDLSKKWSFVFFFLRLYLTPPPLFRCRTHIGATVGGVLYGVLAAPRLRKGEVVAIGEGGKPQSQSKSKSPSEKAMAQNWLVSEGPGAKQQIWIYALTLGILILCYEGAMSETFVHFITNLKLGDDDFRDMI